MTLWSGWQNVETEQSVCSFITVWYEKLIFTCWEHYVRVYSDLKTFHCPWTGYFSISSQFMNIVLDFLNVIFFNQRNRCLCLVERKCSHWTFMPLDFSSGPMWKSAVYIAWSRIVRALQHKIEPECDKITVHKLWYVQAAVKSYVIKCHKLGGPTVLKLLQ
jgi:hypothetical protein